MTHESQEQPVDWSRITLRKAEYLREFADGYTEPEVAARLGVSGNGVRSAVDDLRSVTGCGSVRELGRLWRARRHEWLAECAKAAGMPVSGAWPELPDQATPLSGA